MSLRFEAKNTSIQKVLFTGNKFRIPRYQRPYAWGEDQISEFWNDLVTNHEPYFIGSLIFNYEYLDSTGFIEIIDGQQRLLTITIFSAVVRDVAAGIDKKASDRIQRQDIALEDIEGKESFLLIPGDTTYKYFKTNIQERGNDILSSNADTQESQRIKNNYKYIWDKINIELSKYSANDDKIKYIDRLRKRRNDLIVIEVIIKSEEEAYEIFETTNARGVDLSVADLLKNLIFRKIPAQDDRDFAKDVWNEIINDVESQNLKKFLRYFWISKHSFVTEKKLFLEIKHNITEWDKILGDLQTDAQNFKKLLQGTVSDYSDYKHGNEIYDSVYSLKLMGVSQCYVLLLSILRNYKKLKTDPQRIIKLIENFTFKFSVVCQLAGNRVEKIYSKYAIYIENAVHEVQEKRISGTIQKLFSQLENELKVLEPKREVFDEYFLDLSYINSEKGRMLIKYILGRIDSRHRKTKEEKIDFTNVNIEHILPQKPCKKWDLNKQDIKGYVNKLGNLTLLDISLNSKAQNETVDKKIVSYEESGLPITRELVKTLKQKDLNWGEDQIIERQKLFSGIAYNDIWNS